MEAVAVSALLNILVPKFTDVTTLYSTYMDRREELAAGIGNIKEELEMMRATLEDNHKWGTVITNERKAWIERVGTFAQDTEDCIDLFLHPAPCKRKSSKYFERKIKALQARAEAIKKDNPWPPAREQAAATEEESDQDLEHYSSRLVGMEEPIRRLLELVVQPAAESKLPPPLVKEPAAESESRRVPVERPTPGSESLPAPVEEPAAMSDSKEVKRKVISIVGFGGLGKTRLAREVYNHPDVEQQFPLRAWVRAAGHGAVKVLQEIYKELGDGASTTTDVQQADSGGHGASTLPELIRQHIESCRNEKRYCIVIDDIRTTALWHEINSTFPEDLDGTIIVTTTMQPVANVCTIGNGYVYKMPTLSSEMSQELFFGAAPLERPAEMNGGLTGLLKKCDGLPLALISVLEYLKREGNDNMFEESTCKEACRRFRNCLEDDPALERMKQVLVKKYNGLPDHGVKACLLYFHLFTSDNPIKGDSLTRQWLAEGFGIGEVSQNLKTLLERSIIQPIQVSNNLTVKSCRPPGIMLEYISYKSISENFITSVCGQNEPPQEKQLKNARRFSLSHGAADTNKYIKNVNSLLLRTLAISGKACKSVLKFSKYELLRVLDLKNCDYQLKKKQLEDIGQRLQLLKYLGLWKTCSNLPRDIGLLKQLETLELGGKGEPVGVYEEVIKLPKLKYLIGKFMFLDKPDNKKLQKHLSDNSVLETLSGFVTGNRRGFAWLMSHMMHLRKVKIWYNNSNADQANLAQLSKAIKEFTTRDYMGRSLSIVLAIYSEVVLNSLKDEGSSLTSLKLSGDLRPFVSPTQERHLTGLGCIEELCLSLTQLTGDAILSTLSNLVSLKDLKLVEDKLGPLVLRRDAFKGLKRICLVCEAGLDIRIEDNALPQLVSLHMICEDLGGPAGAGIEIGGLLKLKEIALHPGVVLETIEEWKEAAGQHRNRPNVMLIDSKSRVRVQHIPTVPRKNPIKKMGSKIATMVSALIPGFH